MIVNYGLNRVRFPPVKSGSRIRGRKIISTPLKLR